MSILRLLYPPKCVLCGHILEDHEQDLCPACRRDAPVCTGRKVKLPFIKSWTALWFYEDLVRRSLLRYKFHGASGYARSYARLLARELRLLHPEGFDYLTWAPISTLRKMKRGYDQGQLLAEALGRELGMEPVRLLKKIRHNKAQSGISGQAHRRANVLGVYKAVHPELLAGKRILLLDDIITTGATLGECARILLTAGAKEIHCAAVACARHDTNTK